MSLSAIPVPAPAAADPPALFQLRCAHRRRARSLARSLATAQDNIPCQSAYRLLDKISKPAPIKGLICTKRDVAPPADLELLPNAARFRLSPFHSALATAFFWTPAIASLAATLRPLSSTPSSHSSPASM